VLVIVLLAAMLATAAWLSIRLVDFRQTTLLGAIVAMMTFAAYLLAPAVAIVWFTALRRVYYRVWYLDLPLPLLLAPVSVALAATWVVARIKSVQGSPLLPMLVTYAWSGAFGALNVSNFCQPGWCGRYGFPFTYYEWSDAIMSINGVTPSPFHAEALNANAVILVSGGVALAAWWRHQHVAARRLTRARS